MCSAERQAGGLVSIHYLRLFSNTYSIYLNTVNDHLHEWAHTWFQCKASNIKLLEPHFIFPHVVEKQMHAGRATAGSDVKSSHTWCFKWYCVCSEAAACESEHPHKRDLDRIRVSVCVCVCECSICWNSAAMWVSGSAQPWNLPSRR